METLLMFFLLDGKNQNLWQIKIKLFFSYTISKHRWNLTEAIKTVMLSAIASVILMPLIRAN